MAKKKLEKKISSKKSEEIKKKRKKLYSRKALAKFANSNLNSDKSQKLKQSKKSAAKRSANEDQLKNTTVETRNDTLKFANTDATSWRKMKQDASVVPAALASGETVSEFKSTPENRVQRLSKMSSELLSNASVLLAIATGIAILFAIVMATLPGGVDAVPAMGGVLQATAPLKTAQIVFFLDILFPITFGAGFALLATAFQTRGNRPIVRMILTALLFVVLADFSENSLVFKALTGGETYPVQWPLTVIKYAMLGISAVLLSAIMVVSGVLGTIAMLFLRFVFPLSIAFLVAGIGGRLGSDVVGASFPIGLLLLALYANSVASSKTDT
jgi:hypothetical protein